MRVTVCIPAFQAARFVGEAVESVLAQTLADWEAVVVDDGSTDGTAEVVEGFRDARIRLHRHSRNRGQAEAWNTAVRLARAPLVKFLPADDVLRPDCLERMEAVGADFVFCRRRLEGDGLPGWRERYTSVHDGFGALEPVNDASELLARWLVAGLRDNWIGEPTVVLARTELIRRAGLFNSRVAGAVDMDLWARALLHAETVAFVDEELAVLRLHGGSVTARVHGRPRVSLDRAWLIHGVLAYQDRPELKRLRREAEVRALKDAFRAGRLPSSAGRYALARLRTVPLHRPLEPVA